MKTFSLACSLLAFLCSAQLDAATYTIVVSQKTAEHAEWSQVVKALQKKHEQATVVRYAGNVGEALETLQRQHPRYTCFVATPDESTRQFVADVHRLTRRYDDDPYTDTLWGILTGYGAANALEVAKYETPLTVKKVASGTEVALGMCQQGMWYDELVKGKQVVKTLQKEPLQLEGPADTTHALADTLTDYRADLFVTSGHATERNWQIGYSYQNGFFKSQAGKMYGETIEKERFEIQSENPKILLPIGNCLMGHIDGPDAMALAWMNNVGVKQMIGYTVLTWYGYGGWGVLDYFVEQPGRYTLAEAFHANHHSLIHRLETCFEVPASETAINSPLPNVPNLKPNAVGLELKLSAADGRGLLYDRDVVAFYGDPAWSAKMASMPKAYDQELSVNAGTYTFTITPNQGADSFKPINTNGAQRGWRPIVHYLPNRVGDIKIVAGQDLNPVVTDDFILIPNPRECDPSRTYQIIFTADLVQSTPKRSP